MAPKQVLNQPTIAPVIATRFQLKFQVIEYSQFNRLQKKDLLDYLLVLVGSKLGQDFIQLLIELSQG